MNGGKWGGRKTSARITAKKEEQALKREDLMNSKSEMRRIGQTDLEKLVIELERARRASIVYRRALEEICSPAMNPRGIAYGAIEIAKRALAQNNNGADK
jgi:hypothetical protein